MSALTQKSNVLLWLNWIKVVAIVMVIILHVNWAVVADLNQDQWPVANALLEAITVMAVPLFVMASGYGLLDKQESAKTFFSKRMSKILWPWLFWSVISLIIVLPQLLNLKLFDFLTLSIEIVFSQSWFMPMIVGLYLMTPWLRKLLKKLTKSGVIFFALLLFSFFSILNFLLALTQSQYQFSLFNRVIFLPFAFLLYYLLGFIVKKYLTNIKLNFLYLGLICIGVLIIVSSLVGTKLIYIIQPNLALDYLSPHLVIQSFLCFLFISQKTEKKLHNLNPKILKVVDLIKPHILSIYLVNKLVMELIFHFNLIKTINDLFSVYFINTLLISGVVFIISLIMAYGFQYFNQLLKIIFSKKKIKFILPQF